ncbi:MAG: aldehyde dehydrogenase family protein [Chloroflexaceae bacterium]|nr:aldehyde dehydrogenase family protein [Chloroflexaceae bacterium]
MENTASVSPPIYHFLLAGQWHQGGETYEVRSPYHQRTIGIVSRAGPADLERAIQAAVAASAGMRRLPLHQRAAILRSTSEGLSAEAEEIARTIAQEAAKPIKQARAEVQRSIFTFAQAAEEATRLHGEVINLDASAVGEGRYGIVRRFPVGPVAAITPFNFPLNLVAHKLAPAFAAGCPVVLKPASQTPLSSLKLAEIMLDAGCPEGALSVLPMQSKDATPLVEDERFKLLTFTGSPAVGWAMKNRAGRKRVMLELGGNAGVMVHQDADLSFAASRITTGGFAHAGQSCISVQRIFVHRPVYDQFMHLLVPSVQALKMGDPLDEETDLSSLIAPTEAERVAQWLEEARAAGATVVTGGGVRGGMVEPTILVGARPDLAVNCQEVFAPVVTVQVYDDFETALELVNDSDFGLQAGVFTHDVRLVWRAYETLEVGGVIINDVPTWRVDHMPYGGVKQSGFGREGVKYAIEEMTEPRLLVLNVAG